MFQFTPFPSLRLYIHLRIPAYYCRWVPPFGYLRVVGYLLLTAAFRSLSRPSSPPRATGIPHAPFCVPFFLQRNFFKVPSGTSQKPYWSLTLVCSCETFVFLLVLADILALCRTDVSLPACQCSLLMWRITDSNR